MKQSKKQAVFSTELLIWYKQNGRHDLPWQSPRTPYRVWLSEIMLQQTQVATVIPYFENFLNTFPNFQTLASAPVDDVMALWAGLGYYTRARNLHKAAIFVANQWTDADYKNPQSWLALSGVGPSTANAIVSQSFDTPLAILDGNVKRVLTRYLNITGCPANKKVEDVLWQEAKKLVPKTDGANYTQAIMDLGATICKRSKPMCACCPVQQHCQALLLDKVAELPTKKPKKVLPKQERFFALIQSEGKLLMEKRPPTGIWGGLWSLPEFETEALLQIFLKDKQYIAENKPVFVADKDVGTEHCRSIVLADPLHHKFSHYELTLKPILVNVIKKHPNNTKLMESDGLLWYKYSQIPKGISTPINKLIKKHIN